MIIGVPRESFPGERRVALVPGVIPNLVKAGFEVVVEAGAGAEAGYPDADYTAKGARLLPTRAEVFATADLVAQVLGYGSNDRTGNEDLPLLRRDQILVGFQRPLGSLQIDPGSRGPGRHVVRRRADAADDAGAEHGRAVVDGDHRRVQGGRAGRREAAADLPDADHGGGDDHAGAGAGDRRRRGRAPGDRHGEAAGRRRLRLRHAAGLQGAGPEPGRPVRRAADRGPGRAGRARLRPRPG